MLLMEGDFIKKDNRDSFKKKSSFQTHNRAPRDLQAVFFSVLISIILIVKFNFFERFYDFSLTYNHIPGAIVLSAFVLAIGLIAFTVRRGKEMFTDLTEWQKLKQYLQKEKEWSDLIIDNAPNLIVGLDQNSGVLLFNKFAQQLSGYSLEEILGETFISTLVPEEHQNESWKHWNDMIVKKLDYSKALGCIRNKNGEVRSIFWNYKLLLLNGDFKMILCIGEDVTERQISEKRIKESLDEKEVLLKEVHHRVKNNLQIIVSMLNMQINQISEDELKSMLRISQSRIRTIAMIHEALYNSADLVNINYGSYLRQFMRYLIQTYKLPNSNIDIETECDDFFIDINLAIPCSLILNELVSNAMKHAFKGKESGLILVKVGKQNSIYHLIVEDNGIGIKENLEIDKLNSLGLILVRTLTTQIKGKMKYDCSAGCRFEITFKDVSLKNHNKV